MTDDTKKIIQLLLQEISAAKEYSKSPEPHDLFISAETIISSLAYLIGPLMDAETAYRQKIKKYVEEGDSNAKAESRAMAEEEYKNWRKIKMVYELSEEQVKLIKKFGTYLQGEYNRA